MTTNHRHDDDRSGGSEGSGLHQDFWGDQAEWTSSPSTTDDTAVVGVRSSMRGWADRFLSGRVEPTRSHRVIGADSDPTPVHHVAEAAADEYSSGQISVTDVETRRDEHQADEHQVDDHWDDERWDEGWDVSPAPIARPGVDPLLARIGGLAVVLTLLVPLALGMRSDPAEPSTAATSVDTTVPETVPPVVSVAADAVTPAPPTEEDSTTAQVPTTAAAVTPTTAPVAASVPPSVNASALIEVEQDPADTAETAADPDSDVADVTVSPSPEPITITTEAATGPRCGADYEVAAGDFWLRLADAAKVDLADLLAVNGATVDTALYPGRTICLPEGARTPAPPTTPTPTTAAPTTAAPTTAAPTTAAPTTAAPTTAAPTTAAPAPTPSPAAPADIEQIIRDVWPDDLEERALQIAWRESNYVPTAKNFCCYGLFQMYWEVHRSWLADIGVTSAEQLYDPTTNARAAYTLYQRAGGWGPWGF